MKVFERDGDRWVRFQTIDPQTGEAIPLEARVSRKARILQSSFDESERRPVVELSVTIGHITQLAEFTLSDRSHLSFPVLIGRNVLRDMMLVDVGLSHTMNQIRLRQLRQLPIPRTGLLKTTPSNPELNNPLRVYRLEAP